MEAFPPQLQQTPENTIESWDDDEDLQCSDDIQFRTVSAATSVTGSSARPSGHRDSISSRRSCRSDSNFGDDDNWQLLLHENDESSTQDAIASAKNAGVPIPSNVPETALVGGTIKRLGGKKIKSTIGDDWSEDLEFSGTGSKLELKLAQKSPSPDSLGQIGPFSSPPKHRETYSFMSPPTSPSFPSKPINALEQFRDTENDSSFDDVPTIKVGKSRPPRETILPPKLESKEENFDDLELPADGQPLRLSVRRESASPDPLFDDVDTEWAEGSIGVRFGGTKRDIFSNRSSSVSALSPSLSSCITAESEEDVLDGLVLPDGPLDLSKTLQKKQQSQTAPPSDPHEKPGPTSPPPAKEDFFDDIEIGNGEIFDATKLTLNRNIKQKSSGLSSPARRTATTITFTSKTGPSTRIPRLAGHDRLHSTHLEPVSETGAPVPKSRRAHPRLSGHAVHSSLSSIPLPSVPSLPSSSVSPARKSPGRRASGDGLRSEPTSAQLLKSKRSVPSMRSLPQSGTSHTTPRPPSRQDGNPRSIPTARPKTPIERTTTDSRINRRPQIPFLPAGASSNQSHHVNVKTSRTSRRADSDSSGDLYSRSASRLSNMNRPETPHRSKGSSAPEAFAASAKHSVTKPKRRRHFGDGTELDIFDDLPTSASMESKFVKHPIKRGAPRSLRNKLSQSHIPQPPQPPRSDTPVPSQTPTSPSKQDFTPRFARDTNASRNAREQRIASMASFHAREREATPLAPLSTNWKAQAPARTGPSSFPKNKRLRKNGEASKPHLIKPMGSGVHEPKCKLMFLI